MRHPDAQHSAAALRDHVARHIAPGQTFEAKPRYYDPPFTSTNRGATLVATVNRNWTEVTQLYSVFAQDQYTCGRLTLSGAVRWDRARSYAPVEGNGVYDTSFLNPAPITFPKTPGVDAYNDISPRAGIGYDVFGNGRTL